MGNLNESGVERGAMPQSESLKPCAHCESASVELNNYVVEVGIRCCQCGSTLKRRHQFGDDDGVAIAEAIAAWNRRPSTADRGGEVEEALAALKPFADFANTFGDHLPDDIPLTKGSPIAARQVTAGDFKAARAAAARIRSALATTAGEAKPVRWPNNSDKTVPRALRYLAEHDRPIGGEQDFNSAHLEQLADEIEAFAAALVTDKG